MPHAVPNSGADSQDTKPPALPADASPVRILGEASTYVAVADTSWAMPFMGVDAKWQWEHRTGYKDYDPRTNAKIERAYQRGECKVSVKSGKERTMPMILFFIDRLQYDPTTKNVRNIQRLGSDSFYLRAKRYFLSMLYAVENGRPRHETYKDYTERRERLLDPILDHQASVIARSTSFLRPKGLCERIVQCPHFENALMVAVLLNAAWIAYEADNNTAATMSDASVEFQIVENCFCAVFVVELLLRFGAFNKKSECLKDAWFCFDLLLVILMVIETWIVPFVMEAGGFHEEGHSGLGNMSVLRVARLVRLTRVTRLVRWIPQMITLLKGIACALRSVMFTLLLLVALLFVFGIIFKTFNGLYPKLPATEKFITVSRSMWSLLLHGIFLDEIAAVMNEVHDAAGDLVATFFLLFISLGTFTILNMLIGFQCEVAARVATKDKENAEINFLRTNLLPILECYDQDGSQHLEQGEFSLLLQDPQVADILSNFGTAVSDLMHLKDVFYENKLEMCRAAAGPEPGMEAERAFFETRLSYQEFLNVVLRLRGQHASSVTDIVELREYMRQRLQTLEQRVQGDEAGWQAPSNPGSDEKPPAWAADMAMQLERLTEKVEHLTSLVSSQRDEPLRTA